MTIFIIIIYLLPLVITGISKRESNAWIIVLFLLSLLFIWAVPISFIFWIIALILNFTEDTKKINRLRREREEKETRENIEINKEILKNIKSYGLSKK